MDTTVKELMRSRRRLDAFLRQFDDCVKTAPSRGHLRAYLGGQLSGLPRKSVEPIALEAGVPPRTLQEFLSLHHWDHEAVRGRVQEIVMRDHAGGDATAVIDETSFPKKGNDTTGVQRQYCGATGKIDNCVVSVHLGYAVDDFFALVDGDLYLPEETWASDAERRMKAGVPDSVVFRPKWRIALDLLDRSMGNGMRFRYLTADEEYGRCALFRRGAAKKGLIYVVEIPCSLTGWTKEPPTRAPSKYSGRGRKPSRVRLAASAPPPRRVEDLWKNGGPPWTLFHIKETGKGPLVWEARAARFRPWEEGLAGEEGWLIVARNALDGETKYFFSNAPEGTPLEEMLSVGFSRWCIERLFEDGKGEIGMDHFEVRRYLPLIRHLILSMVGLLFLVTETKRLRKKKSLVERRTGPGGNRGAARPAGAGGGAGPSARKGRRQDPILAAASATGGAFAPQTKTARPASNGHLRIQNKKVFHAKVAL